MKVKKNKLIIFSISSLIFLLLLFGIILFLFSKYNIGFNQAEIYLKNGLTAQPASLNKIQVYNSGNQNFIDVIHYDINIELFPDEEKIIGDVTITAKLKTKNIQKIEFNFYDNFDITSVVLNNKQTEYNYKNDKITLPSESLLSDTFQLRIKYNGKPESLGFGSFNFSSNNNEKVIYTLNEPIYASTWFPCNDNPLDKATADISITNDSSMISVSNGVLENINSYKGKKTFHWKTEYPIATYLISVCSAKYTHFTDTFVYSDGDSLNLEYYVFPQQLNDAKVDFGIYPEAIKYYSELFGKYPFIKEKYGVVEFTWKLGAMENQSIIGIGKNFISGRNFFTGMLVHELAHQWWGDAVTLKSWKDIWLNEGFATYSEALYWEMKNGKKALSSTMNSYLTDFKSTTLYNPDKLFGKVVYNKGAWVLHMLRKEVGDSVFFSILKNYYEKFKYKNASTLDFIKIAEKISKKNLNQFFNQWVFEGKGKIKIVYDFMNKTTGGKKYVTLIIKQIQKEYKNYTFPLDIELLFNNGVKEKHTVKINMRDTQIVFPIKKIVKNIILDPEGWLAANIKKEKTF